MLPWSDRKPPKSLRKRPSKPDWLAKAATHAPAEPPRKKAPSHPSPRQDGNEWELRAAQWLAEQGLKPVGLNVACRRGEIDLIFADGHTAVVVEVRRRASSRHGSAAESIDWHKRRRIAHTALLWWAQTGARRFSSLRFDTLTFSETSQPLWTRHAFDAEGSI